MFPQFYFNNGCASQLAHRINEKLIIISHKPERASSSTLLHIPMSPSLFFPTKNSFPILGLHSEPPTSLFMWVTDSSNLTYPKPNSLSFLQFWFLQHSLDHHSVLRLEETYHFFLLNDTFPTGPHWICHQQEYVLCPGVSISWVRLLLSLFHDPSLAQSTVITPWNYYSSLLTSLLSKHLPWAAILSFFKYGGREPCKFPQAFPVLLG